MAKTNNAVIQKVPRSQSGHRYDSAYNTAILIRKGSDEDAEFFFALDEQTTWESLPRDGAARLDREEFRQSLCATHAIMLQVPGNTFFIAEEAASGERTGLLWFAPKRNLLSGEDEGWIYNLTVCAHFRGRGIARSLMCHAEEHARRHGYAVIGLSVATHNRIARDLYEALGYEPCHIQMRKVLSAPDQSTLNDDCALCRDNGSDDAMPEPRC